MSNIIDVNSSPPPSLQHTQKTTGALPASTAQITTLNVQNAALGKIKGISETSTQEYNSIFGNTDEEEKVTTEYNEMLRLGGLDGNHKPSTRDLRTARMGLALLSLNRNPEICIPSLKNLQILIKNDPMTSDSSADLIPLIKIFLNQMDKSIQEEKNKEVRIEFLKTFSSIVELILIHNACDHLGKITEEFKIKLDEALDGLGRLDSKKDTRLTFYIKFSREGIKRFKDDSQIVLDIIRRIFHLTMAGVAYFYTDIVLPDEIKKAFLNTHIKMHLKEAWYEQVILIRQMTKLILDETNELTEIQKENMLKSLLFFVNICPKEAKEKWPFYFEGVNCLAQICLNSNSKKLRTIAFEGCGVKYQDPKTDKQKRKDLKGLGDAANFKSYLLKKRFFNPTTAKYQCVDYNAEIRLICIENLIKIADESNDVYLCERAKNILISRLTLEESPKIQFLLSSRIPANPEKQIKWLEAPKIKWHSMRDSKNTRSPKRKSVRRHSIHKKRLIESEPDKKSLVESTSLKTLGLPQLDPALSSSEDNHHDDSFDSLKEKSTEITQETCKNIQHYTQRLETLLLKQQNDSNEDVSNIYLQRGICYVYENQIEKGKKDFKSAYKINGNYKAAFELAKLHAELKENEKVKKWADRVLTIQPNHQGALKLSQL